MKKFLREWPSRHQHIVNLILHFIGLPMVLLSILLPIWKIVKWHGEGWWYPILLFLMGFSLQYIGHRIEGNEMSELAGIKKRLNNLYFNISRKNKIS
jgi:hypothetical protein